MFTQLSSVYAVMLASSWNNLRLEFHKTADHWLTSPLLLPVFKYLVLTTWDGTSTSSGKGGSLLNDYLLSYNNIAVTIPFLFFIVIMWTVVKMGSKRQNNMTLGQICLEHGVHTEQEGRIGKKHQQISTLAHGWNVICACNISQQSLGLQGGCTLKLPSWTYLFETGYWQLVCWDFQKLFFFFF